MDFYYTAYGHHRCLFCGSQGGSGEEALVLFECGREDSTSFEELVEIFGPYVAIVAESVGTKVIVCSCREHIRNIGLLRGISDQKVSAILACLRAEIKEAEKNKPQSPPITDYYFG